MDPIRRPHLRRPSRPSGLLAFGLWLAASGCGGPPASPSDPAEGRKVLHAALDAWKDGQTPDALSRQSPAIHVTDGDWMSGFRLKGYKAVTDGTLVGSDVNYNVQLELKTARGVAVTKNAVYAVTTRPQRLVHRQDTL